MTPDKAIAIAEWVALIGSVLAGSWGIIWRLAFIQARFEKLESAVLAGHRRTDEQDYLLQSIRDVLVANGTLRPQRSHSRPPLALTPREEEPTPS